MEPKKRLLVTLAVVALIAGAMLVSFGRNLVALNTPRVVLADTSGSGFVYYITTSRAFTWEDPLDGCIYQGWRYPYVRSGQTLAPDYRSLSPENIQLLLES